MSYNSTFNRYLYYSEGGDGRYPQALLPLVRGIRFLTTHDLGTIREEDIALLYGQPNTDSSKFSNINGILTKEGPLTIERWEQIIAEHSGVTIGFGSAAYFLAQKSGAKVCRYVSDHKSPHLIWIPLLGKTAKIYSIHDSMIDLLDMDETEYELLAYTSVSNNIVRHDGGVVMNKILEPEIVWFPKTKYLCVDFPMFWTPRNKAQEIQTTVFIDLLSKILGVLDDFRKAKQGA